MRKIFTLFSLILIVKLSAQSTSCAPLQVPTVTGSTVTASNLLLNLQGTTVYTFCPDVVDVEVKCASYPFFSGLGVYTYTSAAVTHTFPPYPYPTMSINISSFCPGTVYNYRIRESKWECRTI